jgi:hypothetical protein
VIMVVGCERSELENLGDMRLGCERSVLEIWDTGGRLRAKRARKFEGYEARLRAKRARNFGDTGEMLRAS